MKYAKKWTCSVCEAPARPSQSLEAITRSQPFGFAKVVRIDLKYLKDSARTHCVALSMVDGGAPDHVCVLVKNRDPTTIARKIMAA